MVNHSKKKANHSNNLRYFYINYEKLNYTIDKLIDQGTFGKVYLVIILNNKLKATLNDTGEKVAIKKVF